MKTLRRHGFLIILLPVVWSLAVAATWDKSATFDEGIHLTSGYTYWATGDYRLHPENGMLPQRWAGLPLWLSGETKLVPVPRAWSRSDKWEIARQYLYGSGNDPARVLFGVRAFMALVALAVVFAVYVLSRRYFGKKAACLSALTAGFSPMILGHGALATSDVMVSLLLTLYLVAQWRYLQRPSRWRGLGAALLLGLLLLSKMSAIVALPLTLILLAARIFFRPRDRSRRGFLILARFTAQLLVAVAIIWMAYGFRFSRFAPGQNGEPAVSWSDTLSGLGIGGDAIRIARDHHLLPDAYLYGMAYALNFTERPAFLAGQTRDRGWWYFFPVVLVLKNSPYFLALVVLGFAGIFARRRRLRALTPLFALLVLYSALAMRSPMNIGERHLFPVYPVLFVLAGASTQLWRSRRAYFVPGALALFLMVDVGRLFPHFLTYFSPVWGGPVRASHYLVDSSLDWGQDLPGLKKWIDEDWRKDRSRTYYLSYFGTARPGALGIRARALPSFFDSLDLPPVSTLSPGTYCVSATLLQGMFSPYPGKWSEEYERLSREKLHSSVPRERLTSHFGRLLRDLRNRPADAQIGNSIYIFRVSQSDLDRALGVFTGEKLAPLADVGVDGDVLLAKRAFPLRPR